MKLKNDDKAFIFTLKNRHRIEPSKFLKKKDSERAIACYPRHGPIFGYGHDICIRDNCNKNGGWIFGGYTTKSWSGDGIYNKYDIFNNQ